MDFKFESAEVNKSVFGIVIEESKCIVLGFDFCPES